jgi:hypothetical protein
VWAVVTVVASYLLFVADSRNTVIAGHDAAVSPSLSGYATLELGAYLPNIRYPTGHRLGVDVVVGKTNLDSYSSLLERYAVIGAHPAGEVDKVTGLVRDMLLWDIAKGSAIGLVGPLLWTVVGARRRRELASRLTRRRLLVLVTGGVVAATLVAWRPLMDEPGSPAVAGDSWEPIETLLPYTAIPRQAKPLQIQSGLVTSGSQRLIESAFNAYRTSVVFYEDLARRAAELGPQLRQPLRGETVALLVTDRHDNVGMDPVARAIGDAGGATVLFDAGDDTSTGEPWETFSLDSLVNTFGDMEQRYQVPGNHDNGSFVTEYLSREGFTVLSGDPLTTDDEITLLGVADPRSSGLGNWRTDGPVSFEDQAVELADVACSSAADGERVSTLLVHDAALGDEALRRGCVDLVLAGHLHTQVGPDEVTGLNGQVGVKYTNGTTGGAAYAVAVGTKLRRDAQVTLITYRGGRPVGLQPVWIGTTGTITVEPFDQLRVGLQQ